MSSVLRLALEPRAKTSQDSLRSTPQDSRLTQNGSRLGLIYGANTLPRRTDSPRLRECTKINKTRAKAEEKRVKEQAKAEAKVAKAEAKSMAKPKAKPKAKPTVKIAPTVSRKVDFEDFFEQHLLVTENLRELSEIEANMLREAWTVTTRIDTIMLNNWLDDVSKYQAAVVTNPRAQVPEPIKLTSDVCFSTPMVSMGRRRVAGVKYLREVARGAPKGNRERIDNIVKLYESNEIKTSKRQRPS